MKASFRRDFYCSPTARIKTEVMFRKLLHFFLETTIIPMQLDMILEKEDLEKGAFLGLILFWSSILSIILCPLFGAISDRCTLSIGRRKPFIILAGVLMVTFVF